MERRSGMFTEQRTSGTSQTGTVLKKRLQRNSELHERYSTVTNDMLSKGYAQKVPEEEHIRQDGFVWYLPLHPVHHPLNLTKQESC